MFEFILGLFCGLTFAFLVHNFHLKDVMAEMATKLDMILKRVPKV